MDEIDFHVDLKHIWEPLHPAFSDNDYIEFEKTWPADRLPPVTMGPWVPVEYRTDELLVLRRNPYYWKVDETGQQLPYLDEVVFEKGSTGVGRTLNTMAGTGDHSNLENPSTFIETLKREQEPDAHFYVNWGPETLGFSMHMNQSASLGVENDRDAALRELFRQVEFRRAVSHAIDRDGVGQAVVRGPFLRAWPGGLYPGAAEFDRSSVVYYPYSPDAARTLLADLGFEDTDGNGILNWTSGPLEGDDLVIASTAGESGAHEPPEIATVRSPSTPLPTATPSEAPADLAPAAALADNDDADRAAEALDEAISDEAGALPDDEVIAADGPSSVGFWPGYRLSVRCSRRCSLLWSLLV